MGVRNQLVGERKQLMGERKHMEESSKGGRRRNGQTRPVKVSLSNLPSTTQMNSHAAMDPLVIYLNDQLTEWQRMYEQLEREQKELRRMYRTELQVAEIQRQHMSEMMHHNDAYHYALVFLLENGDRGVRHEVRQALRASEGQFHIGLDFEFDQVDPDVIDLTADEVIDLTGETDSEMDLDSTTTLEDDRDSLDRFMDE